MMLRFLDRFEKVITAALIVLMVIVVSLATLDLAWLIVQDIVTPPLVLLDVAELLDIFGLFLLVLIGIELLDTIRAYLSEHVVHEEVLLVAALIAVARKVIVLDVKEFDGMKMVGIGAIVLAISIAYWIVKRMRPLAASDKKEQ